MSVFLKLVILALGLLLFCMYCGVMYLIYTTVSEEWYNRKQLKSLRKKD